MQLMAEVYTAASRVDIWLGPEEDDGFQYAWAHIRDNLGKIKTAMMVPNLAEPEVTLRFPPSKKSQGAGSAVAYILR